MCDDNTNSSEYFKQSSNHVQMILESQNVALQTIHLCDMCDTRDTKMMSSIVQIIFLKRKSKCQQQCSKHMQCTQVAPVWLAMTTEQRLVRACSFNSELICLLHYNIALMQYNLLQEDYCKHMDVPLYHHKQAISQRSVSIAPERHHMVCSTL